MVIRGHSWSFVVTRGHSCVLLDKAKDKRYVVCLGQHGRDAWTKFLYFTEILNILLYLPACVQKLFVILKDRKTKIVKIQILETECKNKMYLRKALLKRPFPLRKIFRRKKIL